MEACAESSDSDDVTQSFDLVRRAKQGDAQALNRLFERYYERVRAVVRMRLGSKLREVVESGDVLQETFKEAVVAFERFEIREDASIINWLARLAEHKIIGLADFHGARKRDHARNVPMPELDHPSSTSPLKLEHVDGSTQPLEKIVRNEEVDRVVRAIAELSEEHRELILHRNYMGASWEAVAKETGRPSAAAARMAHARAMIELGKLIDGRDG
jgi:RNA polymerase sigma-70 factor (ECF subfamily)